MRPGQEEGTTVSHSDDEDRENRGEDAARTERGDSENDNSGFETEHGRVPPPPKKRKRHFWSRKPKEDAWPPDEDYGLPTAPSA
jgi:hypothetical protein